MSVLIFPPSYYYINTLPLESTFQASLYTWSTLVDDAY
jgi:hypothetical protein